MAKKDLKKGQRVKYIPSLGNDNPDGKTVLVGKVENVRPDGLVDVLVGRVVKFIEDGQQKERVEDVKLFTASEGKGAGFFQLD